MLKTKCLDCGKRLKIDMFRVGYFLGFDTEYYGDCNEPKDPHSIIGYYCSDCGSKLREKAVAIGWKRID